MYQVKIKDFAAVHGDAIRQARGRPKFSLVRVKGNNLMWENMAKNDPASKNTSRFDPSMEKPIFQWTSPDRLVYKKTVSWYAAIILIAIVLSYILYTQRLWSGIGLVAAAVLAFIVLSGAKPRQIKCSIYPKGILVGDKVYRYNDFKSFWITYIDIPKIRIQLAGLAAGQVELPLQNIDPEQVRLYLARYLPEDEKKGEDLVDIVNRFLKF